MSEENVYIGRTSIQIGQNGFINQPKEIIDYIKLLQTQLQQKENIIKEVREYMNKHEIEVVYLDCKLYETKVYKDILEILDKEVQNEYKRSTKTSRLLLKNNKKM
jgi:hypothetical protein